VFLPVFKISYAQKFTYYFTADVNMLYSYFVTVTRVSDKLWRVKILTAYDDDDDDDDNENNKLSLIR